MRSGLPSACIIFPGAACWKELVKGFAAMQASALQRTSVMKANRECRSARFVMIITSPLTTPSSSGSTPLLLQEW
jgi:hypothetical protein